MIEHEGLQPNQNFIVDITDLGINGEGVGKYGDYTVFVAFALPGERVEAFVEHIKKNLVFARLKNVILESSYRQKPICNRFGRCGGCDLLHLDYDEQLAYKKKALEMTLSKALKREISVDDVVKSEPNLGYRNKVQLPFGIINEKVAVGFYRPKTHKIVSITKCFLQDSWIAPLVKKTLVFANDNELSVYEQGKGLLRYLVARYIDDSLFVTLVINGDRLKNIESYYESLLEYFPKLSLSLNINKKDNNVILTDEIIVYKSNIDSVKISGIKLNINPLSFFQVNDNIREKIYKRITDFVINNNFDCVIDAFGGIGLLGAIIAKNSNAKVFNIDIVKEAIIDANRLAKENNLIPQMTNLCGDAKDLLPQMIKENLSSNSLIILDPPRKGLSKEVIDSINAIKENISICYISCNMATLARDLSLLKDVKILSITPYDMFANTSHIEILCCLTLKK